jgi:glutathione peroxidase
MKTAFLLLATALLLHMNCQADDSKIYSTPLKDIDGKETSLQAYKGKVLLIVNVASKCGFTPQYEGLEALWRKYKDQGLIVVGFPSNDFGAQEPGSSEEIKQFCKAKYDVTFPLFEKIRVKGPEKHPLYLELTGSNSPVPGEVKWNFGKFLISRDGRILSRFDSGVKPDSAELTRAVEGALSGK